VIFLRHKIISNMWGKCVLHYTDVKLFFLSALLRNQNIYTLDHTIITVNLDRSIENKKLSYRQWTVRRVLSVEILPIAKQQCRNYLYDKS